MKIKELLTHNKYKTCPYCKKQIRKNALKCKWCGRFLIKEYKSEIKSVSSNFIKGAQ